MVGSPLRPRPAPGASILSTFTGTQFNSFLIPKGIGRAWLVQLTVNDLLQTGSERVRVERLDNVWSEIVKADDVVYLKVDAQGFDLQVLHRGEV